MVSVDALTVEFGGTTLFKDISFVINPKDRIALMGKNGAGKIRCLRFWLECDNPVEAMYRCPKTARFAICHNT